MTNLPMPPHSIEAEQAVLGAVMLDGRSWHRIGDLVGEEDFYRRDHRTVWRALSALVAERKPHDVLTVREWLDRQKLTDEAGGAGYLITLAKDTPSAANVRAYAEIVRTHARARRALEILSDAQAAVYAGEDNAIDTAVSGLMGLNRAKREYDLSLGQALTAARDHLDAVIHGDVPVAVKTGLERFDRRYGGLHDGDLIVVASRPSHGKTAFGLNIGRNAVELNKIGVGMISGEQGHVQMGQRHLAHEAKVSLADIRAGRVDAPAFHQISEALGRLLKFPYRIYDRPAPSLPEVQGIARYWKREHGLGLLVVDYLQRMSPNPKIRDRHEQVAEIARGLKELARELNIPVLALAQVNRDCEKRKGDKRPLMGDLADSSAIEKEADQIVTLYRDEVYHPDTKDKGIAELNILKTRNGPIGMTRVAWIAEWLRFENLAEGFDL